MDDPVDVVSRLTYIATMRMALGIEYDGSAYHGWQIQDNVPSVQEKLEIALAKVADHPVRVQCAGRTDTGVHAVGQVVHFDTDSSRSEKSWVFGTNTNLPIDISVSWAKPVAEEFHARFLATRRTYRYYILNRSTRSANLANKVTWENRSLDLKKMQEATSYFIGEHDFSAFRAIGCQAKSPVRTVYQLELTKQGSLICLEIEANAFLHHMVRNIVGVLMSIGMERNSVQWAQEVLESKDRASGGVTAPAQGLYLVNVVYPEKYDLPVQEKMTLSI